MFSLRRCNRLNRARTNITLGRKASLHGGSVHFMAMTVVVLSIGCAGVPAPSPQNPTKSQLVLTSGVVDFGNVPVGHSTSQSLAITNQGNASVTVSQINI